MRVPIAVRHVANCYTSFSLPLPIPLPIPYGLSLYCRCWSSCWKHRSCRAYNRQTASMGNKLCATWQKGYHAAGVLPWPSRKEPQRIRLVSEESQNSYKRGLSCTYAHTQIYIAPKTVKRIWGGTDHKTSVYVPLDRLATSFSVIRMSEKPNVLTLQHFL